MTEVSLLNTSVASVHHGPTISEGDHGRGSSKNWPLVSFLGAKGSNTM